jgi:hypothetical protein
MRAEYAIGLGHVSTGGKLMPAIGSLQHIHHEQRFSADDKPKRQTGVRLRGVGAEEDVGAGPVRGVDAEGIRDAGAGLVRGVGAVRDTQQRKDEKRGGDCQMLTCVFVHRLRCLFFADRGCSQILVECRSLCPYVRPSAAMNPASPTRALQSSPVSVSQ